MAQHQCKTITARQAAQIAGVALTTVYSWTQENGNPGPAFTRKGGRLAFQENDVRDWLDARAKANAQTGACVIDGCHRHGTVKRGGLCSPHRRLADEGLLTDADRVLPPVPRSLPPAERLRRLTRHDPVTGCWVYLGRMGDRGYGTISTEAGEVLVHRYAYELHTGKALGELTVDHLCSRKACVNPAHLEAVTREVNTSRRWERLAAEQERVATVTPLRATPDPAAYEQQAA